MRTAHDVCVYNYRLKVVAATVVARDGLEAWMCSYQRWLYIVICCVYNYIYTSI